MKLSKPIVLINVFVVLLTLLAYSTPYINPTKFWLLTLFGVAYPWLLLVNTGFLLLWLVVKKWYFLISFLVIGLWFSHVDSFIGIGFGEGKQNYEVKVLSYNLNGFYQFQQEAAAESKLFQLIKKEAPDIICFQEANQYAINQLDWKIKLEQQFPNTEFYQNEGQYRIVFSRFPIIAEEAVNFKDSGNGCHIVDLKLPSGTTRLFNVHLQSNKITSQTDKLASEHDLQNKETWREVKSIFGKMRYAAKKRAEQARHIEALIQESPYPHIICGDLNDTPLSYAYQRISKNQKDGFKEKGTGFATTYNGNIPALRIDYIFCSDSLEFTSYRTPHWPFSDHWPVIATLNKK